MSRLGTPLYEQFYAPYAEKVWGRRGDEIAVDQAERRVNQRSLADLERLVVGLGPGLARTCIRTAASAVSRRRTPTGWFASSRST